MRSGGERGAPHEVAKRWHNIARSLRCWEAHLRFKCVFLCASSHFSEAPALGDKGEGRLQA